MNHHIENHENETNTAWGFAAGMVIGGLVGAGTMLLLAPQSGKKTLAAIQEKTNELRDQTTETVEDAVSQASAKARKIADGVRVQAKDFEKRGKAMFEEQKEKMTPA